MQLRRPQAFAGFLIVGLLALGGFAAFSATGFRKAPPIDIPVNVSASVAGGILGLDLGPDSPDATNGNEPAATNATPDEPSSSNATSAPPVLPASGQTTGPPPP